MSKPITMDKYDPLVWIDEPSELDRTYIDFPEQISKMTEQANFDVLIENVLEKLFDFGPPPSFATFAPFSGYMHRIKKLFVRKVLVHLDLDEAINKIDKILEEDDFEDPDEGEKLYELVYTLSGLNDLLETIYLKIRCYQKP